MGNPYTQPSLSGYNASPPSDDGSASSSNQLEWSKHIQKIGNPLRTFTQAVDSAALAAFGLTFGATILAKTASYTVTTADRGRFITVTGTSTITLPDAASAGDGFPLLVVNIGAALVTVDGDTSETINGLTSIVLPPGGFALLTCNGTSWAAANGAEAGEFTANWTGFSSSPSTTWKYNRVGGIVTMYPTGTVSATSDATGFSSGAGEAPAAIRPINSSVNSVFRVTDNGTTQLGVISLSSVGTISFNADVTGGAFTASGTKGFIGGQQFTYSIHG